MAPKKRGQAGAPDEAGSKTKQRRKSTEAASAQQPVEVAPPPKASVNNKERHHMNYLINMIPSNIMTWGLPRKQIALCDWSMSCIIASKGLHGGVAHGDRHHL